MNINSDLSSQVSEQQETTSTKQLSLAFDWGFQTGTFLHQCFIELGPRHLQQAQQWCLVSQSHPPPYTRWIRIHSGEFTTPSSLRVPKPQLPLTYSASFES